MKWDIEEAVLLVNLYFHLKNVSNNEREQSIIHLSSLLDNRAKVLGIQTTSTFRNVTGIKMKLQNIKFLENDGNTGLSVYSEIDKKAYSMYLYEPAAFNHILNSAKGKYETKSINGLSKEFNAMESLRIWMKQNGISERSSENIIKYLDVVNKYMMLMLENHYVYKKEVDWSLLNQGMSIPLDIQVVFQKNITNFIARGESKEINFVLDGNTYKATLINQKFDKARYPDHKDILQIRYNPQSDIAVKLRSIFFRSYEFILEQRNYRLGNTRIYVNTNSY